jgi:hypothetical protein
MMMMRAVVLLSSGVARSGEAMVDFGGFVRKGVVCMSR